MIVTSFRKKMALGLGLGISVAAVAANSVGPVEASRVPAPSIEAPTAPPLLPPAPPLVASAGEAAIAAWERLRDGGGGSFADYAGFLAADRGWPGETAMRRAAEARIGADSPSAEAVVRYFAIQPPLTQAGRVHHAFALLVTGKVEEARAGAREAWRSGPLSGTDEARLRAAFGGALTAADHERRMEVLLAAGNTGAALRTLGSAQPAKRPLYEARIALQRRAPDAAARLAALPVGFHADAGLFADRLDWLRATDRGAARRLLEQPRSLVNNPENPLPVMEAMLAEANGAAERGDWNAAMAIAGQLDDLYAAGTAIRERGFDERDAYTDLAWLAATAALHELGRPADAAGMFERYARAAQSPQTQTKGLYWAGRAAEAAGQDRRAQIFFREAAGQYDQFHGQLALERVEGLVPARLRAFPAQPGAAERTAFYGRPLVAAIRHLGRSGDWKMQTRLLRSLAAAAETDAERMLAIELGTEIGRPDLGVIVARHARNQGSFAFEEWGFPKLEVPAGEAERWAIVHGITRQESLFDREARSHVGASGLMQLMPGTAREQAGKLGLPYDAGRVTADADYNVMLGSTYFARLLKQWDGSYPLAVASYNAGAGNVRKWVRRFGDPRTAEVDMVEWIERIPFSETRNYVQRVLENAVVYAAYDPAGRPEKGRLSYYLGQSGRS